MKSIVIVLMLISLCSFVFSIGEDPLHIGGHIGIIRIQNESLTMDNQNLTYDLYIQVFEIIKIGGYMEFWPNINYNIEYYHFYFKYHVKWFKFNVLVIPEQELYKMTFNINFKI